MKRYSALALVAAGLMAFVTAVRAETVVTIKSLEGEVSVVKAPDGKMGNAAIGMKLSEGDEVHTGFDSKAQLSFADNSIVTVEALTQFRIHRFEKKDNVYTTRIQMRIGSILADVKKGDFTSDFQIDTPNSTTAVEGTVPQITSDTVGDRHKAKSGEYIILARQGLRWFYVGRGQRGFISPSGNGDSKNNLALLDGESKADDKPLIGFTKGERQIVQDSNGRRRVPWNPGGSDPTNPIGGSITYNSIQQGAGNPPPSGPTIQTGGTGVTPPPPPPPPWPGWPGGGGTTSPGTTPPPPPWPGGSAGH